MNLARMIHFFFRSGGDLDYGSFTSIAPRKRWKEAAMPGSTKLAFMTFVDTNCQPRTALRGTTPALDPRTG